MPCGSQEITRPTRPPRRRPRGRAATKALLAVLIGTWGGPLPGPNPGSHGPAPLGAALFGPAPDRVSTLDRAAEPSEKPLVAVVREGAVWARLAGERFAPVSNTEGADRAVFSADGRFLAVHKRNGELWLIAPGGEQSWLLAKDRVGPDMAWSPKGERLAYIRAGALWVVPCGPAGPKDWSLAASEAERFAWSPDGNRLYVATPTWVPPPPPAPAPHPPGPPGPHPTPGAGSPQKPAVPPGKDGRPIPRSGSGPGVSEALPRRHPAGNPLRAGSAFGANALFASAGPPVRQTPVRILEVRWRGGMPKVWGELPLTMGRPPEHPSDNPGPRGRWTEAPGVRVFGRIREGPRQDASWMADSRSNPPIWGVDGICPAPGGQAVALVVRDAPDAGRTRCRTLIALTRRSAAPLCVWHTQSGAPLTAAGWVGDAGRLWLGFVAGSDPSVRSPAAPGDSRRGGAPGEAPDRPLHSALWAWQPPRGTGLGAGAPVRLTPDQADDRFAAADLRGGGWLVARARAGLWQPGRLRPRALWAVRPDGRSVQISRPPFGSNDTAGWWGPDEQWVWLQTGRNSARLWWWSRREGRGEPLLEGLPRDIRPDAIDVRFPAPATFDPGRKVSSMS